MKFEEEIHKLSARVAYLEDHLDLTPHPSELPVKEAQPDLGPVRELPMLIAVVTRNPEGDPLAKTSGDDEDAGDWTTTGDGTDYPRGVGTNPTGEPVSVGLYLTNLKDPNAPTTEEKAPE